MKVVAISNAHALAHVSRLLEVAKPMREQGHEILFAGTGKYLEIAAWDGFQTRELPYITVERVVQAVRTQRLWELYREPELEQFIAAELALYAEFKPDWVLIDNRPTARTSAEKAGIRSAAVLNVHMSNYREIPFFSYAQQLGAIPGLGLLDRLENSIERQVYDRLVMGGLNRVRRKMGLPRLCAYEHEEGAQYSFLADVPAFNPVSRLPERARFIGPLTWHNTLPAPACLARLDPQRPLVYFSLGSEGLEELVGQLAVLSTRGVQVVVAAGAADLSALKPPPGVYLEQYVNTEALLPHCRLVCCHGGNGTLYQALAHGLPCVVVATHAEQHYGGKRIQQLGLGKAMTLKQLRRRGMASLVAAVSEVLETPHYRATAQAFIPEVKRNLGGAALVARTLLGD
ncbi:MAG TPA: glycosyltransferase [Pseudomonadales bacterium]|nr:glycosyltransferase [Pseudomonadales bacterium]